MVLNELTGARLKLAAISETPLPVLVVVVVTFATGTSAVCEAISPPPWHEVKPRKSMKACSPAGSSVTRPEAEAKVSE